ncbi:hypothetical protein [Mangrovihabitans endophyticus]|uniref:Pyridine nucleotide-disulphide oxidoreductase n=1 Tax=Mangrovihabitans endophyticus TaxID=1751298 RepID=A0A8J3C5K4_9ACTN|nr:hypothetical protein [Mangrovihabitans endophyticus]GGL12660.1 hypothetical protein GCM10012284_54190 [Mangrovihabitans endophyticus]
MFEPSTPLSTLLARAAGQQPAALQAALDRVSEFPSPAQAQLTGLLLDPAGRQFTEEFLDSWWADAGRRQRLLQTASPDREVIIGSGVHAAVYAAVRVQRGFAKPLVLERGTRVGGTFALTGRPAFYLNSRNRRGVSGIAGDQGADLNYLPGAPVQAADLSMREYQPNTDLGLAVRLALAQYADVVTEAEVAGVDEDGLGVQLDIAGADPVFAGRVIDARGLGDPRDQQWADGVTICTFEQFMRRMAGVWPLRGVRRVAVIGGGDCGKCAVESCLGLAPPPVAGLDRVEQVDWYAPGLPDRCKPWRREVRGRYQSIGRYLRPDRRGTRRLMVLPRASRPVGLPGQGLVDGRGYDLVVVCTGYAERRLPGLGFEDFTPYAIPGGPVVAAAHDELPVWRVGPHARLGFCGREYRDGLADNPGNAVAVFRTVPNTAALAATLTAPPSF